MQDFVAGQRWFSDGEFELGLGTVLQVDDRTVTVVFMATGETRTYARHSAPLTRALFGPGDRIENHDGLIIKVTDLDERDGLNYYQGWLDSGEQYELCEAELSNFIQFNQPQERLLCGQVDRNTLFELRSKAQVHHQRYLANPMRGLCGARIRLLEHQLYIAQQVSQRFAPRVLLADEVGLGKTIEAGLIVHALLARARAQRVLIIVPQALLHQWLVEMLRRFNLRFALFDAQRRAAEQTDSGEDAAQSFMQQLLQANAELEDPIANNPFNQEQLVLCSLDWLQNDSQARTQVLATQWDVLVVDEAHHLEWSEDAPSTSYELVQQLATKAPSTLLLTATPEQLGQAGHFARLHLLDPLRFPSLEAFLAEEREYAPVADCASALVAEQDLSVEQVQQLELWLDKPVAAALEDPEQRQALVAELTDRHGTGRVLFRNTREHMRGFPQRLPNAYPLELPETYASHNASITPERDFGTGWAEADPRVDWLAELLKKLKRQKVLLICAHADTTVELEQALRERFGIYAAVFNEQMSIVERDRAAAWFSDSDSGSQLLICSEIGSEGRNFQFLQHLVLFDLPANPDLLEQRIGRLDRIGQQGDVNLHIPYLTNSNQQTLYRWYAEGLNALAQSCPAASHVYAEVTELLANAMANPADQTAIDALITQSAELANSLNAALAAGRDRLLELQSCNHELASSYVEQLQTMDDDNQLQPLMEHLWDACGVDFDADDDSTTIVRPGNHMLIDSLPELPDDGVTVTFNREQALAMEDLQLMSWDHPMVQGAMDVILHSTHGSTAFVHWPAGVLAAGTLLLQANFLINVSAAPAMQAQRYFPQSLLPLIVDQHGRNLSQQLNGKIPAGLDNIDRKTANKLIKAQQPVLRKMLQSCSQIAQQYQQPLCAAALETADKELSAELQRLHQLAQRSPNVRKDEIEQLENIKRELPEYLQSAQLKLDSLRLIAVA